MRLGTGPDGFTVARRLREQSDVALLFLTGADEPDELRAGFEAGADLYVTKPFSVDALLVQVEAVLARNGKSRGGKWEVGDLVVDEGSRVVTGGATGSTSPTSSSSCCAGSSGGPVGC